VSTGIVPTLVRSGVRERLMRPAGGRDSSEREIISAVEFTRRRNAQLTAEHDQLAEEAAIARDAMIQAQIMEAIERTKEEQQAAGLPTGFEPPAIPKRPSINAILSAVSDYYDISLVDIIAQRRINRVVRVRHVAMYLARMLTTRSLPQIGIYLGGRDHTTVLHGVRKVELRLQTEPSLAGEIAAIKQRLGLT
jgi:chromosomal replication initiation ATPase DnaA